jgi:hypothetical protein
LADLALDVPRIHIYLTNIVIVPLMSSEKLNLQKITWVSPPQPKKEEEDEDDYVFGNDPFFKMAALVLGKASMEGYKPEEVCKNWGPALKTMFEKIDEPESIWEDIKKELKSECDVEDAVITKIIELIKV